LAERRERFEVDILDVREVTTYPVPGKPFVTHIVTYRFGDMAPRTVFIPASEDTPEGRAKAIREDIEKAASFKPGKITV
jgi:hypothetical protein